MSNEGSDKNVGSMEDDIKIVKELLKGAKDYGQYNGNKYFYSIENILQDYTRQKQLNEEHQKLNGELREKVKELEEENAMLKKTNNIAKEVNIEDVTDVINKSCKEFMSNYIPKQAVIEALEDIKDYFDRLNGPDEDIEYIRQVKEELLEGGK